MTAATPEPRRDAIISVRELQVRFQTSDRRATVKAVVLRRRLLARENEERRLIWAGAIFQLPKK